MRKKYENKRGRYKVRTGRLTLSEARQMINNDRAGFADWYVAGLVLCSSDRSTLEDLLTCLKRRVSSWCAAKKLHVRTRRRRIGNGWVTDPDDWRRYLKEQGKI